MKYIWIIVCGILLFVAVSIGQVSSAQPARAIFYRADGVYPKYFTRAAIKLDGVNVHKIGNMATWSTAVVPGEHLIQGDEAKYGAKYMFEAGKTYYFAVRLGPMGVAHGAKFRIVQVADSAEATGFKEEN
jgi:hypothetical protein